MIGIAEIWTVKVAMLLGGCQECAEQHRSACLRLVNALMRSTTRLTVAAPTLQGRGLLEPDHHGEIAPQTLYARQPEEGLFQKPLYLLAALEAVTHDWLRPVMYEPATCCPGQLW